MSFFTKAIPSFFKSAGNGIVKAAKAVGNGVVTAAKAVAKSVSKDGVLTKVVEKIPVVSVLTAPFHAAAGNTDRAQLAGVKGLSSTVTVVMTAAGALAGPGGAVLMGAAGSVAGDFIEAGFKPLLKPTVRDELNDITLGGVGMSAAFGAGSALLGPAGKALKGSSLGKAGGALLGRASATLKGSGAGKAVSVVSRGVSKRVDKAVSGVSKGVSKFSTWISPPKYGPAPRPGRWNPQWVRYKNDVKNKVYGGAQSAVIKTGMEVANPIAKKIDSSDTRSKLTGAESSKSSRGPLIAGAVVGTSLAVGAGVMIMKDKPAQPVPVVGAPAPQKDTAATVPAANTTKPAQAEAPVVAPVAAPKPAVAKAMPLPAVSPAKPGTGDQTKAVVQPPAPAVESVQNVPPAPAPAQQQAAQPPAQRPVQQPAQAVTPAQQPVAQPAPPAQQQVAQPAPPAQRPGQSAQQPLPAQLQLPPQVAAPSTQGAQRPLPAQQQLPPQQQYPAQPAPQPYYPPVQAPPPQQTAPQPYYPPVQAPPPQQVAPKPYYPPIQAPPPQQPARY